VKGSILYTRMNVLMLLVALLLPNVQAQDIPYKPDEEYTIRVDLKFKPRPMADATRVEISETRAEYDRRTSTDQLPFLNLYITTKESAWKETRLKVLRDGKVLMGNRKIELGKELKIEVGFTDDAKDGISGQEHIVYYMDESKKEISRIVITIEKNGDYIVNGVKRGRF
jgi:hypothetical protein